MSRIEHKTLNDRAYEEIRSALTMGRFAPMQPLVIRSLADAYGISVTPIREALQRLVAERLLEVLPNRSIVVPAMTSGKFRELLHIRMALEGMAVELATPRLAQADFDALRRLTVGIAARAAAFDAKGYLALNKEFHFSIYGHAESPELMRLIQDLWLKVGPVFTGLFDDAHFRLHANDEHTNILAALERRDGPAARAFLVQDLRHAADALLPRMIDDMVFAGVA